MLPADTQALRLSMARMGKHSDDETTVADAAAEAPETAEATPTDVIILKSSD